MANETRAECDQLQQLLGARDELIRQLERQIATLRQRQNSDAHEWRRLTAQQRDLEEWLIGSATNRSGKIVTTLIDARLGGDRFVPGSFSSVIRGRRYQCELASTIYSIRELAMIG